MNAVPEVCSLAQNLSRNCGYAVFPCKEDKSPATKHGFKDAVHEPEAVAQLWRRYPGPLIGIATGEASGVSVLDVDVKADEALAWWREHEIRLPITRTYRTRSGGLHLFFRHAPGVRTSAGKPTRGIDVRGEGGYVVFWFGAGCECLDHAPPAAWPHWLTSYFWPPPKRQSPPAHHPASRLDEDRLERVRERALQRVRDAADGQKHDRLRAAARLLGGIQDRAGFSESEAIGWLMDALPAGVRSEAGARKTAEWGLARGREHPLLIGARR